MTAMLAQSPGGDWSVGKETYTILENNVLRHRNSQLKHIPVEMTKEWSQHIVAHCDLLVILLQ